MEEKQEITCEEAAHNVLEDNDAEDQTCFFDEEEEDWYDPTKPIKHRDIEYCEICNVPICYCRFFGHIRPSTKYIKKVITLHLIRDDGTEVTEEEEGEEEEEVEEEVINVIAQKKKGQKRNVIVTVKARTKRKNTTSIANLEDWEIDIKDFSKEISKKMAIGCSYNKTQTGIQVVIQGDVGNTVIDILLHKYNIPKENIEAIRKTKKKPTTINRHQPPPQPMLAEIEEMTKQTIQNSNNNKDKPNTNNNKQNQQRNKKPQNNNNKGKSNTNNSKQNQQNNNKGKSNTNNKNNRNNNKK